MQTLFRHVRELHSLGPASNDHLSALRMAVSVAVPSLVLLFIGRADLTIYAVCGAITGMYGRNESHLLRISHQMQAALVLLSGVTTGVLLSINLLHGWWLVLVEAIFAGVGSIYADRVRLKPNGPFFGILALGACASVPVAVPWYVAVMIAGASATFSLFIGFAGWVRARDRNLGAPRAISRLQGQFRRKVAVHAARYIVAVGAAGASGVLSGSGHPHWAMAAAAVPLAGADLPSSVHRGIHRIIGTFLGLGVVAIILLPGPVALLPRFPSAEPAVLVVLVIFFQFITELFMTRHYGLAMVSFTPVILLMTHLASPGDPLVLIVERGVETFLGAVTGILVVVFVRSRRSLIHVPSAGRG